MENNYSFLIGLKKALYGLVVVGGPMLINAFPEWANLTISGAILMIVNYAKQK